MVTALHIMLGRSSDSVLALFPYIREEAFVFSSLNSNCLLITCGLNLSSHSFSLPCSFSLSLSTYGLVFFFFLHKTTQPTPLPLEPHLLVWTMGPCSFLCHPFQPGLIANIHFFVTPCHSSEWLPTSDPYLQDPEPLPTRDLTSTTLS